MIVLVSHKSDSAPTRQFLHQCIEEAGLKWGETSYLYLLEDDEIATTPFAVGLDRLMPTLTQMDPTIIVTLGNEAMQAFTHRSGITEKRGEETSYVLDGKPVTLLPTFHPWNVMLRVSSRATFVADLVRARRLLRGEPLTDPADYVTFSEVPMPGAVTSFDFETDGNQDPRLVGIGSSPEKIYIIDAKQARVSGIWDADTTWVGHNLRADQKWLRQLGREIGPRREDTMLMAHLLNENRRVGLKKLALEHLDPKLYWRLVEPLLKNDEKRDNIPYDELATYCANDVAATLILFDIFKQQLERKPRLESLYRNMSMPLNDVLLDVETHGVGFDVQGAIDLQQQTETQVTKRLEEELNTILGHGGTNWSSDVQVENIIYNVLGLPKTKTTPKGKGKVDEKALMKMRDLHPLLPVLLKHRKAEKLEEILVSWITRARGGRILAEYNQTGTVTGRLSGRNPNPQNLPTDARVRRLIIPHEGNAIVSADYKTIELGTGAWIYDEPTMLAAYTAGDDLHTLTATKMLGRPPANKDERKKYGKTPNFGLLFQQGDEGYRDYAMKQGVDMTLAEAAEQRAQWHNLYPGVRAGWRRIGLEMKANGGTVTSPSGRERHLPEFLTGQRGIVNDAWRAGCNFPVQCTAAEFTHCAAILAAPMLRDLCGALLVLHVHDSLVFEVPFQHVMKAAQILKDVMERHVPDYYERHFGIRLPIPIRADVAWGPNWGDLTEVKAA